jgi:hypothetical protein
MTMSRAQGGRRCCGPEHGTGRRCHGLGEDDVVAGSGTTSWAWGRHLCCRPWSGMMTQRLRGGLDNGAEAPWTEDSTTA